MGAVRSVRPRELPQISGGLSEIARGLADWRAILNAQIRLAQEGAGRVVRVTANYAMRDDDALVVADATGGAITVTLPEAAAMKYRRVNVKKIDATAYSVIVRGFAAAETIDDGATVSTLVPLFCYQIWCDGQRWYVT